MFMAVYIVHMNMQLLINIYTNLYSNVLEILHTLLHTFLPKHCGNFITEGF